MKPALSLKDGVPRNPGGLLPAASYATIQHWV
jgi:hypothetical protein